MAGALLAGCNENFDDWAAPQGFDQVPVSEAVQVTVAPAAAAINISDVADGDSIQLFTSSLNMPAGYELAYYKATLVDVALVDGGDDVRTTIAEIPVSNQGKVAKDDIQNAITTYYGKRPTARSMELDVVAYAYTSPAHQTMVKAVASSISITATPEAPVISAGYYLVGDMVGWDYDAAVANKFTHSDADVYEDPIFVINFTTTADNQYWKIIPQENIDGGDIWAAGVVGTAVDGATDFTGQLINENAQAGKIEKAGKYRMTINMMDYTYTLEQVLVSSAYYLVGDMVGWDYDAAVANKFSHSDASVFDDPVFSIIFTTTADNQYWKIIPQENIDAGNIWADGVVGTVTDGETALTGSLTNKDAQAGKIETAGKYRLTINMSEFTYKIEPILFESFVYFIGATDGWSAADQKLALSNEEGLYRGFVYCADPNGWGNEFKFQRVAGSWDNEINSGTFTGGITGDFEDGGGNIKAAAGEGVYYVELDLGALTLKATKVEKMGIIGDFNGWGGDVEMTWNATDYCFEATNAGATAAGWKFRVNADWAVNLGGTLDNLDYDGANIGLDANTIRLYPTRKTNDNIYCTAE